MSDAPGASGASVTGQSPGTAGPAPRSRPNAQPQGYVGAARLTGSCGHWNCLRAAVCAAAAAGGVGGTSHWQSLSDRTVTWTQRAGPGALGASARGAGATQRRPGRVGQLGAAPTLVPQCPERPSRSLGIIVPRPAPGPPPRPKVAFACDTRRWNAADLPVALPIASTWRGAGASAYLAAR